MRWTSASRMRMVWLAVVAGILAAGGAANADFTFGTPVNLGPPVNTSASDIPDCITAGGLEMFLDSRNRPGGYGGYDGWVTTRDTIDDEWRTPVNLGPMINTAQGDGCGYISDDGLELYLHSNKSGGFGTWDIWVSRRDTKDDTWGIPENLGPVVNSSFGDACPWVSPGGLELYFGSERPGGYGDYDIWVTRRITKDGPWGEPMNLGPVVNSSASECWVSISSDGLVLFVSEERNRPIRPGGFRNVDMWMTRRASVSDPWGTPVNLGPTVNGPSLDCRPLPSRDGSTLYFCSTRPGNLGGYYGDIYQAPILPVADFNGDGIVNGREVLAVVDCWGTDDSLCDIGPMPWGDGIVDVEDLKVLAEHIGKDIDDPILIAHWPLNETEGDIAYDSSYENDGVIAGGAVWRPEAGAIGGALEFDGVDGCIETPRITALKAGPFSVFAWVKGGGAKQVIVSRPEGSDWLLGSVAGRDGVGGKLATKFGEPVLTSDAMISDGQWHRVGLVYDGTSRILYVDDVPVDEDQPGNLEEDRSSLYIGCGSEQSPDSFFSGLIDDVRIYNRAVRPWRTDK